MFLVPLSYVIYRSFYIFYRVWRVVSVGYIRDSGVFFLFRLRCLRRVSGSTNGKILFFVLHTLMLCPALSVRLVKTNTYVLLSSF